MLVFNVPLHKLKKEFILFRETCIMDLTLLRLSTITAAYVNLVHANDKYDSLLAGDPMFSTSFLLTCVPYYHQSQNSSVYLK